VEIGFKDRKLEKECNDEKLLKRRHGERRAKLIKSRLAVFDAAGALSDLGQPYQGPYRCHELTGNRSGQLSVDLDHPYRLIFVPMRQPPPQKSSGGLDWSQVTAISILEIVDTHE
jgi:plasmid maintenance system killer protein